jgi:hypothetical protein
MRAMLEWLEVSRNTLCETQRAERSEKDRTPHPDPLPSGERGTEADVHTAPTYPRPFSAHYAPLTAPALDGIASERFAGTGSDGGMSRPPCRSSGRPDAIPQRVAEGRQWCHGRFRAARGQSSLHGEPGCLRRNVRSLGSVDLDCGDKPSPSGGRSEQSAGGQALRFRGNPRGPPERGGKFRSRRRGPTSHYCGLPAMRPGPRRRSSSLVETRSHLAVGGAGVV